MLTPIYAVKSNAPSNEEAKMFKNVYKTQNGLKNLIFKLSNELNARIPKKKEKEFKGIPINYNKLDKSDLIELVKYHQKKAKKALSNTLYSRKSRYTAIKEYQICEDFGLVAALILSGYFGEDPIRFDPLAYSLLRRAKK